LIRSDARYDVIGLGFIVAGAIIRLLTAAHRRYGHADEAPRSGAFHGNETYIEGESWFVVLVPAGTPGEIIALLNRDIAMVTALPDIKPASCANSGHLYCPRDDTEETVAAGQLDSRGASLAAPGR
jgi:hypothetical protein